MTVTYDPIHGETYGITEQRADDADAYNEAVNQLCKDVLSLTAACIKTIANQKYKSPNNPFKEEWIRKTGEAAVQEIDNCMKECIFHEYSDNASLLENYESPADRLDRRMQANWPRGQ